MQGIVIGLYAFSESLYIESRCNFELDLFIAKLNMNI